jgi:RHS repeat-associated protein
VTNRNEVFTGVAGTNTVTRVLRNDNAVRSTAVNIPAAGANLTYLARYDSAGRTVRLDNNGTTTYWDATSYAQPYDPYGRITSYLEDNNIQHGQFTYSPYSGLLTAEQVNVGASNVFLAQNLLYTSTQLASYTDATNGTTNYAFTYDHDRRAASATATTVGTPTSITQSFQEQYSPFTTKAYPGGSDPATVPSYWNVEAVLAAGATSTYNYSTTNPESLASIATGASTDTFTYDPRGSILNRKTNGVTQAVYTYDAMNRLASLANATAVQENLSYDGGGELVQRNFPAATSGERNRFYLGEHADVSVSTTGVVTATINILRHALRVAHWAGGSTMVYYHRDRLGSVVATTMNGGGFGAQYRYLPWGAVDKTVVTNAAGASELKFTGAKDLYGGILHLRSRAYSPTIRRFLQADDVDSLRYSYAGGDPINRIDPSGHSSAPFSDSIQGRGSATSRGMVAYRYPLSVHQGGFEGEAGASGGLLWGLTGILTADGSLPPRPGTNDLKPDPYQQPQLDIVTENGTVTIHGQDRIDAFYADAKPGATGDLVWGAAWQELFENGTPGGRSLDVVGVAPAPIRDEAGNSLQPAGEVRNLARGDAILLDPDYAGGDKVIDGVSLVRNGEETVLYHGPSYETSLTTVMYHELLHLQHPDWSEPLVWREAGAEAVRLGLGLKTEAP